MGRNDESPAELLEKAIANGYKQGAHQAEESKKHNTKWVIAIGKEQQHTGEAPSGDDTVVNISYTTEARVLGKVYFLSILRLSRISFA
ncbi:hypothetical protein MMC21_007895 [Puttea exsequens]|nr:hypothetical protein [Puttea exsequens]